MRNEQQRRLRKFGARRGPVRKCKLCKTTWLLGSRVLIGVCTRCGKMAMRRNDLQIVAREAMPYAEIKWVGDWPGVLQVDFALDGVKQCSMQLSYEEAAQAYDLPTLLAVKRQVVSGDPEA